MEKEIIKVWISKYSLTQGLFEREVEVSTRDSNFVSTIGSFRETYYIEGKEWHRTKEDAVKRAEEMRQKKIKSVEKQLDKLKNLKFE